MSDDSQSLEETLDSLAETIELGNSGVRDVLDNMSKSGELDSRDQDQLLQELHFRKVIDTPTYVKANRQTKMRLKHPRFDHLPDREQLYDLLGALDSGGMGEIRIGRDPYLDRKVAVKLLKMSKITSPLAVERFVREAQVTAKLEHPNVIPIYSLHAENDGRASFSMKLIDGRTITQLVLDIREILDRGERLPDEYSLRRRIELFLRICDAMEYAHDMGVVHRDLKPSNIMVGAYNEVYVMDWGLAKILDEPETSGAAPGMWDELLSGDDADDSVKTQHGALVGTPLYMSPEQAAGRHEYVSYTSDIYSLGAILFEIVCLRRLIPGQKVQEILKNVATGNHRSIEPYKGHAKIARELEAIIERASAGHIGSRYQRVSELSDDLRRYLDDQAVRAHPDNLFRSVQRWMGHHRQVTMGIIFALMLSVAGAIIWSQEQQNQATRQAQVRQQQLSRLQTYVSGEAHRADRQFLRFELLVNRLAVAASQLLREGTPQPGELYTSSDFDADLAPAMQSPVYGKKVSLTHPVFKPAPDVEMADHETTLRKLLPLVLHFRSIFVDSRLDAVQPLLSDDRFREAVAEDGVPGRWAYVGLANGIHMSYPGKGEYPADYDPRERPWFLRGKNQTRPVWGEPYVDTQGQGLVLPCVISVYGAGNTFEGVAGFEVTLDFIQDRFMESYGPITETYVVDDSGRVLIASRGASVASDVDDVSELKPFPVAAVRDLVASRSSGYVVNRAGGKNDVYMAFRMPTLGWYYIALAPMDAIADWK